MSTVRATACTVALVVALAATGAAPSSADPDEPPARVLTAQPLPTWQTNGTVWAIEHVAGVMYVGGNFTAVRPPGAAPGQRSVPRKNLAAFDARTGVLLPFSHRFAAPVHRFDPDGPPPDVSCAVSWSASTYTCDTIYDLRRSPDGARIYAGGDFLSVDGVPRQRLAAFDTAQARTGNNRLDRKSVV